MLRRLLIAASTNDRLRQIATEQPLARRQALRFVAGETLEEGMAAALELVARDRLVSLDHVGEEIGSLADAGPAAAAYLEAIGRIGAGAAPAGSIGVSIKPTQLGLRLDAGRCRELLEDVVAAAAGAGAHVTLDMEDATTTEPTIRLVEHLHGVGHTHVGCAIQAYLHRTPDDVVRLSELGASVRLCKGAYAEDTDVALQGRDAVRAAYLTSAQYLLDNGTYPRFATHDGVLVDELLRTPRKDIEFQLLHGVREELQAQLVDTGRNVLVYLPYGSEWYPYFVRRMAERPANLTLFLRSLLSPS